MVIKIFFYSFIIYISNDKNDQAVRELAIRYIDKIKPDVEKETQKRKETIKKLGEHLRQKFPSAKDATKQQELL